MGKEKETDEKQMSAVTRIITILEVLSQKEKINLENLSKATELPKATLLRFLSTLSSLGYVYRDTADQYSLTLKMFSVGSRSLKHIELINSAKPFAKALCESLGETVHMGIREDNSAVYVLKEESSYTLRMYSRIGKIIPLYCTAIGKIFLSEMKESELASYFAGNALKPFTPHSITTADALKEQLQQIRRRGWSIDDQEHEENVMCIASPIRDYSGAVVAALSVSWPLFRFNQDSFDRTVEEIKETCGKISAIMGYQKA